MQTMIVGNLRDSGKKLVSIDVAVTRNGETVGGYGGRTPSQLADEYDNVRTMPLDEFAALSDAQFRAPVREITQAAFFEALEVLPPEGWTRDESGAQSFKCAERTSGAITNIYAARGGKFYALSDDFTLPHAQIMRRVREFTEAAAL